jgi:hypothetical protein
MKQYQLAELDGVSAFGISRRDVLKAVGVTAVAGGMFTGSATATSDVYRANRTEWVGQGSEYAALGCDDAYRKFVLTPGGRGDPITDAILYVNGEGPFGGERKGNGAVQFEVTGGDVDTAYAKYNGGGSKPILTISEGECPEEECVCPFPDPVKFDYEGGQWIVKDSEETIEDYGISIVPLRFKRLGGAGTDEVLDLDNDGNPQDAEFGTQPKFVRVEFLGNCEFDLVWTDEQIKTGGGSDEIGRVVDDPDHGFYLMGRRVTDGAAGQIGVVQAISNLTFVCA